MVLDVASAPLGSVTFVSLFSASLMPTRSSGQPGHCTGSLRVHYCGPLHVYCLRAYQSLAVICPSLLGQAIDHFLLIVTSSVPMSGTQHKGPGQTLVESMRSHLIS